MEMITRISLDPVPVPVLDLHRVADVQHALLDLHQLRAAGVLEDQCLAQPQGLAVDRADAFARSFSIQ